MDANKAIVSQRRLRHRWLKPDQKPESNGSFFQKPLFIWFMSSIVIGIITYCYTNYHNCRNKQVFDEEILHRLLNELVGREEIATDLSSPGGDDINQLQKIRKALDPHLTYLYIDNKDKSELAIKYDVISIFKKWEQWPMDDFTKSLQMSQNIKSTADYQKGYSSIGDRYDRNSNGKIVFDKFYKFFNAYGIIEYQMTMLYADDKNLPDVKTYGGYNMIDVIRSRLMAAKADLEYISRFQFLDSNYCARRTFWPY